VWREWLGADRHALPSQTPEWLDCVCASGAWRDSSRLYERPEGRLIVLPMVRRWSRPAWLAVEASLPAGWGSGGPVAADTANVDDVEAILADLTTSTALRLIVRPAEPGIDSWAAADVPRAAVIPHQVHVLELEGGFDRVWSERFTAETRKGLRKAARRAEQAGVTFERGSAPQHVAAFYEVYSRWLEHRARERGIPLLISRSRARLEDPRRKFELVAETFGDNCHIDIARLGAQPVAANFAVRQGANMVSWRGMSDKRIGARLRLSELMLQMSIHDACDADCESFFMGESSGIRSLERFKERMGARPHTVAEYRLERLPLSRLQRRLHAARLRLEELIVARAARRSANREARL